MEFMMGTISLKGQVLHCYCLKSQAYIYEAKLIDLTLDTL